ncbi:MAG: transcriptional repressor LexA [Candidatus Paceibacterota bacterium]
MSNIQPLTEKEKVAFRFIRNSLVHKEATPTVKEIAEEVGHSSPRTGARLTNSLIEKGFLERVSRNKLRLLKRSAAEKENTYTVEIPIVGRVACGEPLLADENIKSYVSLDTQVASPGSDYFILRAEGDSMNRAGINDGDLVLIEQRDTADEGEIVVALIDDEATLKRLKKKDGSVVLKPETTKPDKYHPIILSEDFRIQGVYVTTLPNLDN